jgi:pimeloyl-ACP methyl ester carboxylesterase
VVSLLGVHESQLSPDASAIEIHTTTGTVIVLRHAGAGDGDEAAVLFLGGAIGGLSGPTGLYPRVAKRTGGFRVHYRFPGEMEECVADVLLLAALLERRGAARVVLVGHSFGGAVAVAAGVGLREKCAGVVTLATQAPGAEAVAELAAPILLVHGDRDGILPADASRYLHLTATEPKELVIVPGEGHLFEGVVDALTDRVAAFVDAALSARPPP